MAEGGVSEIKQILEENEKFSFKILNVIKDGDYFFIHVRENKKKKQIFAEYCRKNFPKKFKFKSYNKVYEAERFYINVNGSVKIVFALKKDGVILNISSLYECEHPELFANDYLNLSIDEVIKEEY